MATNSQRTDLMIGSIDKCSKCENDRIIVNRKHMMCNECNYKRLNGKSKEEVYSERAKGRPYKAPSALSKRHPAQDLDKGLKAKFSINKISSKRKYKCSNGDLVSEVTIKRKYAEVCDQIDIEREPVCQGTGRGDVPLSHSHTISRARCKELGKTELIWDSDNIEIEGYEERTSNPTTAHCIWEDGTWKQKSELLNFNRKLSYIKANDPETYRKIRAELD